MKKLLIIILLVLLGAGIFYALKDGPKDSGATEQVVDENGNFRPNPNNATFSLEGSDVTLTNGRYETRENNLLEETRLLEQKAYGDLNNDGKEDVAVLLVRTAGASGVFIYTASYVSGPVGHRGTNTVFIGDRVSPQSVSINNGVITVNYLDRGENEPFAAEPTIPSSKQFLYQNNALREL